MIADQVRAERLLDAPIIHADLDPSIGDNIQGPSLIRTPTWLPGRMGRYYLYFADHKGLFIRLAYADALTGPWRIHVPGSLRLADCRFLTERPRPAAAALDRVRERIADSGLQFPHDPMEDMLIPHLASPDVHVDDVRRQIRMYYHGLERFAVQSTRVALSSDGVEFEAREPVLGPSYFRVFTYADVHYAMAMPGRLFRALDSLGPFEAGPTLCGPEQRHTALLVRGDVLYVFHTRVGDAPERIVVSTVDLTRDFAAWTASEARDLLAPERAWEGAELPPLPSQRSYAAGPVNQLRDPAVFVEEDRSYLLYAAAGESGIGIAELHFSD